MMPFTKTDDAAHVEQMQPVARIHPLRDIADKTFQGPALTEDAKENITRIDLGKASGWQLKIAISSAFRERTHGDHVADLRHGTLINDVYLPRQRKPGNCRSHFFYLNLFHPCPSREHFGYLA